jgi:hypothetical protein
MSMKLCTEGMSNPKLLTPLSKLAAVWQAILRWRQQL